MTWPHLYYCVLTWCAYINSCFVFFFQRKEVSTMSRFVKNMRHGLFSTRNCSVQRVVHGSWGCCSIRLETTAPHSLPGHPSPRSRGIITSSTFPTGSEGWVKIRNFSIFHFASLAILIHHAQSQMVLSPLRRTRISPYHYHHNLSLWQGLFPSSSVEILNLRRENTPIVLITSFLMNFFFLK